MFQVLLEVTDMLVFLCLTALVTISFTTVTAHGGFDPWDGDDWNSPILGGGRGLMGTGMGFGSGLGSGGIGYGSMGLGLGSSRYFKGSKAMGGRYLGSKGVWPGKRMGGIGNIHGLGIAGMPGIVDIGEMSGITGIGSVGRLGGIRGLGRINGFGATENDIGSAVGFHGGIEGVARLGSIGGVGSMAGLGAIGGDFGSGISFKGGIGGAARLGGIRSLSSMSALGGGFGGSLGLKGMLGGSGYPRNFQLNRQRGTGYMQGTY